jgi:hypothetical protein
MKEYITPDFDITIYELDDILTASKPGVQIGGGSSNDNDDSIDWDEF